MPMFLILIFILSNHNLSVCDENKNNKYFEYFRFIEKKDLMMPKNVILYEKMPSRTIKVNKNLFNSDKM